MLVLTDEDTLITREQLDRGFKERMKEQERQAVRALVTAKELTIRLMSWGYLILNTYQKYFFLHSWYNILRFRYIGGKR